MKKKKMRYMTHAALIAALYVVLTLLANALGLANYAIQLRFSEALTILPVFTSAGIPGLVIGCFLSNLITGCAVPDILFGSLATLIGAIGTRLIRTRLFPDAFTAVLANTKWQNAQRFLATLPPILSNTLIIPFILAYVYRFEGSLPYFMITVCIGEILSCGILGMFLMKLLMKYRKHLF